MTKFDNLYSTQDHLREEQQKLLKALLQNQSAKTQKPSGAPAGVAPEIDVKKEKDIRVSFHSDKKCSENILCELEYRHKRLEHCHNAGNWHDPLLPH